MLSLLYAINRPPLPLVAFSFPSCSSLPPLASQGRAGCFFNSKERRGKAFQRVLLFLWKRERSKEGKTLFLTIENFILKE
jgi:hypothetical protein